MGACIRGAYIHDVNWVTYLAGVYSRRLIYGGLINGVLRYIMSFHDPMAKSGLLFVCSSRKMYVARSVHSSTNLVLNRQI